MGERATEREREIRGRGDHRKLNEGHTWEVPPYWLMIWRRSVGGLRSCLQGRTLLNEGLARSWDVLEDLGRLSGGVRCIVFRWRSGIEVRPVGGLDSCLEDWMYCRYQMRVWYIVRSVWKVWMVVWRLVIGVYIFLKMDTDSILDKLDI